MKDTELEMASNQLEDWQLRLSFVAVQKRGRDTNLNDASKEN